MGKLFFDEPARATSGIILVSTRVRLTGEDLDWFNSDGVDSGVIKKGSLATVVHVNRYESNNSRGKYTIEIDGLGMSQVCGIWHIEPLEVPANG